MAAPLEQHAAQQALWRLTWARLLAPQPEADDNDDLAGSLSEGVVEMTTVSDLDAARDGGAPVCIVPDCGSPVEDVEFWTGRAEAEVPAYWRERSAEAGNPAGPAGLCADHGAEWFSDLESFREANRCDGACSPYSNCMCQLMLPEEGY